MKPAGDSASVSPLLPFVSRAEQLPGTNRFVMMSGSGDTGVCSEGRGFSSGDVKTNAGRHLIFAEATVT
jgi:hypothetical protein